MNVSREIPLFAVAEKPFVYFQCQMNLVEMEESNGGSAVECPRPKCSSTPAVPKKGKEKVPLRTKRSLLKGGRVSPFGDGKKVEVFDAVTNRVDILPYDSTVGFSNSIGEEEEPSVIVGDSENGSNEDEWNAEKKALLDIRLSDGVVCFARELLLVAAALAVLVWLQF